MENRIFNATINLVRSIGLSLMLLFFFSAAVQAQTIYGLSGNNLVSFKVATPGTLLINVPIVGISAGQNVEGLDFRPATGQLYALGYNQTNGETQIYTLQLTTGVATAVSATPILLKPNLGKISMDFNPTVDRIRVTGSNNANYRLNPITGVLAATDLDLAFAVTDVNTGKNPSVGAGAYTNSFSGTTTTTLYNYDDSLNVLTTQIPPNNGTLNTVGTSGIAVNLADPNTDLDIYYSVYGNPNNAFLVANVGTSLSSNLYRVNLTTGAASLVGAIGSGIAVSNIAIALEAVEVACDVKTIDCVRFELLSITRTANGDKTYRVRVVNLCNDKLVSVAFQLPKGVTAINTTSVYNSIGGHAYDVRNPNFSPFYSIRFKDQSTDGISNVQADLFEYTLPSTANPSYILVSARTGTTNREAYLNVFNCAVGVASASTADRNGESAVEAAVRVFPNPTSGVLFVDVAAWEDETVQLRVLNLQGGLVFEQTIRTASAMELLGLPESASNGLYLLELSTASGKRQVSKILLQR